MQSFHIDTFLSGHVFAFVMIFARIGSAMMLMPGIGEAFVAPRIRLMLAFGICLFMLEPLLPRIPPPPDSISTLAYMLTYEIIIGLFFGTLLRILMAVLETAGMVIGMQSGLSSAMVLNPALASQSPLPSAFLSMIGIVMLFVTGLDHLVFRSMVALYDVFPPNGEFMPGDIAETVIQTVNKSFVLGVELSMPFFVIGLLMYVAMGIMQKLLPQIQLFMVLMPIQIWGGLTLMAVTTAGIITVWLQYFDASVSTFVNK